MKRSEYTGSSELDAVQNQFLYGHLQNPLPVETWLEKHYSGLSPLVHRIRQFTWVVEDLPDNATVLEVGAGAGDFSLCLLNQAQREPNLILGDIDIEYLNRFSIPAQSFFSYSKPISRIQCFSENIPCTDNSIDLIVIKSAVHHFDNSSLAFNELHRCLKSGGRLIFINDPQITNLWKFLLRHRFAKADKMKGYNCRTYTHHEYMKMGKNFRSRLFVLDPLLLKSIQDPNLHWTKLKRSVALMMLKNPAVARYLNCRMGFPISYMFIK
jgi:ubiquinone/menaquinone biosynthesis C-methylase UbiE